jgi:SAM-dependent methyltransferase
MIFSRIRDAYATRAWKKTHQHTLQVVDNIFKDTNGFIISTSARAHSPSLELTYGEIELESFLALLSLARPQPHQHFYDLGCGIGKTVWAASMTFPFEKCIGVERLRELHDVNHQKLLNYKPLNVQFLHQDILDTHWPSQSILYLNIASFIPESWNKISNKLIIEPAEIIITLAKPLVSGCFNIQSTQVMTSWGVVSAYVHHFRRSFD